MTTFLIRLWCRVSGHAWFHFDRVGPVCWRCGKEGSRER